MFKWKPISALEAQQCLSVLSRAGVPLVLSVPMLVRARGVALKKVLEEADCHRSHLHACLRGRYQPNFRMRGAMRLLLGCDPWTEFELTVPSCSHRERCRTTAMVSHSLAWELSVQDAAAPLTPESDRA